MPDSDDRITRLAEEVARQGQQLHDEITQRRELAEEIRRAIGDIGRSVADLGVLKERVAAAVRQSNQCVKKQEALEDMLEEREREQRRERKADRKWLIGTVLASGALVVAALTFLVNHL